MRQQILLFILLVMPASARAANIYVNAGAAAGGNGTLAQPFQRITSATALAAGTAESDTIRVAVGVYKEGLTISIPSNTAIEGNYAADFSSRLPVSPAVLSIDSRTTVTRDDGVTTHRLFIADGAKNFVLDGISMKNAIAIFGNQGGCLLARNDAYGTMTNCLITDSYTYMHGGDAPGVCLQGFATSMTMLGCVVQRCRAVEPNGINTVTGGQMLVKNCIFRENYQFANDVLFSGLSSIRVDVVNCLFANNHTIYQMHLRSSSFSVTNCTFADSNSFYIIYAERSGAGGWSDVKIQNNILTNLTDGQPTFTVPRPFFEFSPSGFTGSANIRNNLFFNNEPTFTPIGGGATMGTNGNITGDPKFVNAAARDYRLLAGSAALGAGVNAGITHDFAGVLRPDPPSIGAFELATSPPNRAFGWTLYE